MPGSVDAVESQTQAIGAGIGHISHAHRHRSIAELRLRHVNAAEGNLAMLRPADARRAKQDMWQP